MIAQISPQQDIYSTGTELYSGNSTATGGTTNDAMDTGTSGMVGMAPTDPTTGSSVQETQAATADPATESIAESAGESSSGSGRSLNANELNALAALLGYNLAFRAYQQPQLADGDLYPPKDIYTDERNYDNPNARFFHGASDKVHRSMVRSQYE